ncbi:MAG: hypothetical protein ACRD0P_19470 [Stackebrandtia sp.]
MNPARGTPIYVLAAAVLADDAVDTTRDIVVKLAVSGPRFHWRHESPRHQRLAVDIVAGLDALHVVVVGMPLDHSRQERARRKCMERLLRELDYVGVTEVLIESRANKPNIKDLQRVNVLRIREAIGPELRVAHGRPLDEPLLWLPDLVAGTVTSNDITHWTALQGPALCEVHQIKLR